MLLSYVLKYKMKKKSAKSVICWNRFMGQMCSSVPQSLLTLRPEITEVAARLSTSFFIETFIHAKEKVSHFSPGVISVYNYFTALIDYWIEYFYRYQMIAVSKYCQHCNMVAIKTGKSQKKKKHK